MNHGYPGANSRFENHNVSEESFWPSFTDIMMVIVMVFLLVTVAVILNNWTLISKLTSSIEAQEAASNLADNRQIENLSLEKELSGVQQNLLLLNSQYQKDKSALEATQQKLSSAAQALNAKEQSLATIENKLTSLNEKYETEKLRLNATSEQLSQSELKLSNTDKALVEIKTQLQNKTNTVANLESKLEESEKTNTSIQERLEKSQASLSGVTKELEENQGNLKAEQESLAEANKTIKELQSAVTDFEKEKQTLLEASAADKKLIEEKSNTLADLETQFADLEKKQSNTSIEIVQLKSDLDESKETNDALNADRNTMDARLATLLSSVKLAETNLLEVEKTSNEEKNSLLEKIAFLEKANSDSSETIKSNEIAQKDLELRLAEKETELKELQDTLADTKKTTELVEATVNKSEASLKDFEELLAKAEQQLIEKDKTIQALKLSQEDGNSQLLSLQGEYDSLDSKYQKLLRPARSSKGKYIASVTYKQSRGKKVIRFKSDPNGSYKTVSSSQLAKSLEALKKKHKEDLYVKVVIPKNSGLSYNEAWRFTINLQRKYDYYYNE